MTENTTPQIQLSTVEVGRSTTRHAAAAGTMTICGAGTKHGVAAYLTKIADGTEGVTCSRCLKKMGA
jgi:hypothetical protein